MVYLHAKRLERGLVLLRELIDSHANKVLNIFLRHGLVQLKLVRILEDEGLKTKSRCE